MAESRACWARSLGLDDGARLAQPRAFARAEAERLEHLVRVLALARRGAADRDRDLVELHGARGEPRARVPRVLRQIAVREHLRIALHLARRGEGGEDAAGLAETRL